MVFFFFFFNTEKFLILWACFPFKEMIKNKINWTQTLLDPHILKAYGALRVHPETARLIHSVVFFLCPPPTFRVVLASARERQLHGGRPLGQVGVPESLRGPCQGVAPVWVPAVAQGCPGLYSGRWRGTGLSPNGGLACPSEHSHSVQRELWGCWCSGPRSAAHVSPWAGERRSQGRHGLSGIAATWVPPGSEGSREPPTPPQCGGGTCPFLGLFRVCVGGHALLHLPRCHSSASSPLQSFFHFQLALPLPAGAS